MCLSGHGCAEDCIFAVLVWQSGLGMSATSLTTGQVASCRTPTIVVQHVSLLAPHLGGEAYSLRSAIVTVFGHCVHRAFEVNGAGG